MTEILQDFHSHRHRDKKAVSSFQSLFQVSLSSLQFDEPSMTRLQEKEMKVKVRKPLTLISSHPDRLFGLKVYWSCSQISLIKRVLSQD